MKRGLLLGAKPTYEAMYLFVEYFPFSIFLVVPVFPAIAGSAIAQGPKGEHLDLVINGVAGSAMQAFGRQLDPAQLASVVHYQRNAFGNDVGDMTQPQDVINISNGQ